MIGVYREFEGCMRLLGHVLRRIQVLALPPVAESLTRQIYFTGASATTGIVLISLGRASALKDDRGAARSFYERALVVSEAERNTKGAAEARSLIEALGDKPGSRQTQPASTGSHAGQ